MQSELIDMVLDSISARAKYKDNVVNSSNLSTDLGIDSLGMVELSLELEDQFNIEFHEDEIEGVNTVGAVIAAVERKVAASK
jgi:acyl carrier protein